MKKLMIVAAAAMLGITATASTVTWGISSALGDSVFKDGAATAYLVYTTVSAVPSFDNEAYSKAHDTYTISDVIAALGDSTDTGLSTTVGTDGLFTDAEIWKGSTGSNRKFYVVVIDGDGENMALSTAIKKSTIQASDTHQATLTWSGSGEFGATQSIPEPTSGLLLLLGVAGLALRRRRA